MSPMSDGAWRAGRVQSGRNVVPRRGFSGSTIHRETMAQRSPEVGN